MSKIPFISLIILFLSSCSSLTPLEKTFTIYSQYVKDSFEVYVSLPIHYDHGDTYNVFYYLDANLKSGKKLRNYIQDSILNKNDCQTIYIGIGHIGNYRVLRRRDFTVPGIEDNDTVGVSDNFGQIKKFYHFFKTELVPNINSRYSTFSNSNSIFGHSFGGLFAIYCLFNNDSLFNNFYSLSPSLWINNYSIYNFNHLPDTSNNKRHLFLSVGSREIFNRIKPGADEFSKFIKARHYPYLSFEYKVYQSKTHNSQVILSLDDIFKLSN